MSHHETALIDQIRHSRFQTPRGALADAETHEAIYLFKNVSKLRLTYQIRLLAFRAAQEGRKLVLRIPKECQVDRALGDFVRAMKPSVRIEKV